MIGKLKSARFAVAVAVMLATAAGLREAAWSAEASPLVVVFDKVEILRLAKPARRVIIGNSAIADVNLETPTLVYLFGKAPGETSLIVLGDDDRTILSRPVVVTSETERAVSVHVPGGEGPVSRTYSCMGNRCLRVASPGGQTTAAAPTPPPPAQPTVPPPPAGPPDAGAGPASAPPR